MELNRKKSFSQKELAKFDGVSKTKLAKQSSLQLQS